MDIILELRKLAVELQKDDRLVYLEQARKMNDMDKELQALIEKFNETRMELNAEVQKSPDDKDQDKIAEVNTRLNAVYQEVMQNDSMVAYNEARAEVDQLNQLITSIIDAALTGGDPMTATVPEGCASGCSSCSGCGH